NAQLGTGSLDFLLNGIYNIRVGRTGVITSATYKINTYNSDDYKYGNKFTSNLIGYYDINAKATRISPNIGVGYENIASSSFKLQKVQYTGSELTTLIAGVEVNFRKLGI